MQSQYRRCIHTLDVLRCMGISNPCTTIFSEAFSFFIHIANLFASQIYEDFAENELKKRKPDYNPYTEDIDEFGNVKRQNMLSKYDEVIDKENYRESPLPK